MLVPIVTIIVVWIFYNIVTSQSSFKNLIKECLFELKYNIYGSVYGFFDDIIHYFDNVVPLAQKTGYVAVITGGTRGIGAEVVKSLLKADFLVVMGCRNLVQGQKIEEYARNEGISTGQLDVYKLNLDDLDSVRTFGEIVSKNYPTINLLINNAATVPYHYIETKEGIEVQFVVNYLSNVLLSHLLMPNLKLAGMYYLKSRIINVTSCMHGVTDINFDDINHKKHWINTECYAQSKLAQVLFTNYLAKKFDEEEIPILALSVNPGGVNTELQNPSSIKRHLPFIVNLLFKSTKRGALPILHTALHPDLEDFNGAYISNCRVTSASCKTKSEEKQKKLFDLSMKMLKIKEFGKPETSQK